MWYAAAPFLFIGTLIFSIGIFFLFRTIGFLTLSNKTTGRIINFIKLKTSRGYAYAPCVEFKTGRNRKINFSADIGMQIPAYKIGEKVFIRYLPQKPSEAKICSFFELWFLCTLCFIFGFVLLGFGVFILWINGFWTIS